MDTCTIFVLNLDVMVDVKKKIPGVGQTEQSIGPRTGIFTVALLLRPIPLNSDAWEFNSMILAAGSIEPNFYLQYYNEGSLGVCKNLLR